MLCCVVLCCVVLCCVVLCCVVLCCVVCFDCTVTCLLLLMMFGVPYSFQTQVLLFPPHTDPGSTKGEKNKTNMLF